MSITIIKAGICDTIQDVGRNGYAVFGINPSGAMDVLAMKTANALVGNNLKNRYYRNAFSRTCHSMQSSINSCFVGCRF